jgi:hypothetical protein
MIRISRGLAYSALTQLRYHELHLDTFMYDRGFPVILFYPTLSSIPSQAVALAQNSSCSQYVDACLFRFPACVYLSV